MTHTWHLHSDATTLDTVFDANKFKYQNPLEPFLMPVTDREAQWCDAPWWGHHEKCLCAQRSVLQFVHHKTHQSHSSIMLKSTRNISNRFALRNRALGARKQTPLLTTTTRALSYYANSSSRDIFNKVRSSFYRLFFFPRFEIHWVVHFCSHVTSCIVLRQSNLDHPFTTSPAGTDPLTLTLSEINLQQLTIPRVQGICTTYRAPCQEVMHARN